MATEPDHAAGDALSSDVPRPTSSLRWSTLPEAIAIVVIAAILIAILAPVVRLARANARRDECKSYLKAIGLALNQYHEKHGSFPPTYVVDTSGKRMHSWRVLILPELGLNELYARYRFDEPWDGPNNAKLIAEMPPIFGCPSDSSRPVGATSYSAIVGVETMWPEQFASTMDMITDGTSSTLMVVESRDLHVPWTEPRDLTVDQVRLRVNGCASPGFSSEHLDGAMTCFADGHVRFIANTIDQQVLRFLGNAASGRPMPIAGLSVPVTFGADRAAVAKSHRDMPKTVVHPTLDAVIEPGKNVVTCATMPIAWDELRRFLKVEDVTLNPPVELARQLNQRRFPRSALSEDSYLALGGTVDEDILAKLSATRAKKFPNATLPLPEVTATDELVIYAYLFKLLPFLSKFDKLIEPLPFQMADGIRPVQSFGIQTYKLEEPHEVSLREQVDVLDYASGNDFILRLKTQTDHIVLAKVAPDTTLDATWQTVLSRIHKPLGGAKPASVVVGEKLIVPLLALYVSREYDELQNRRIIVGESSPYRLRRVQQFIKFQLDESGALIESSVEIIGDSGLGHSPLPPEKREFIFDRPFLLAIHQRNSEVPYLVCWVANEELLVPVDAP